MNAQATGQTQWRRVALLLLFACALLLRFPAGMMPASAQGIAIGWCNGVDPAAMAEGQALFDKALAERPAPKQKTPGDTPCPFAAAAQPMAAANPLPELTPVAAPMPVFAAALAAIPGRGLAAPPPLSTGPPLLA